MFITTIKFDCIHSDELDCRHALYTDETDVLTTLEM